MTKTANLHVRIDPATKTRAEALFSDFGITVSDAITMFLRKSIMVGGLPFDVAYPKYNAETEAAIMEARQIAKGTLHTKTFHDLNAFYTDLETEEDEL